MTVANSVGWTCCGLRYDFTKPYVAGCGAGFATKKELDEHNRKHHSAFGDQERIPKEMLA